MGWEENITKQEMEDYHFVANGKRKRKLEVCGECCYIQYSIVQLRNDDDHTSSVAV